MVAYFEDSYYNVIILYYPYFERSSDNIDLRTEVMLAPLGKIDKLISTMVIVWIKLFNPLTRFDYLKAIQFSGAKTAQK